MEAIGSGAIPGRALSPYQARQISHLEGGLLGARLQEVWGSFRESSEAHQREMAFWKERLTPEVLARADLDRGRAQYRLSCGACHKMFGEGGMLGPELTGSDRGNLDYLLENVIDPNQVVSNDHQMNLLTLADGRMLSGVVLEKSRRTITLQTPAERMTLERGAIVDRKIMPVSIMPEGILQGMEEDAVRDLVGYLMRGTQ